MVDLNDFSYDVATDIGMVRLIVPGETDQATALFADSEITALLGLYSDIRLTAAAALDILASSIAKVRQKITLLGLSIDGPAMAASIREQAKALRDRVDNEPYFDSAEMVHNAFAERERYLRQWMRGAIT